MLLLCKAFFFWLFYILKATMARLYIITKRDSVKETLEWKYQGKKPRPKKRWIDVVDLKKYDSEWMEGDIPRRDRWSDVLAAITLRAIRNTIRKLN